MLPIRDHNPSEKVPFVTYALILINVLVFLYMEASFSEERALLSFYYDYALVPIRLSEGENPTQLLTHMFLHGGWMHLLGNMLFLWIYGDNMEEEFGHVGFLIFYLLCGLAAAMLQYLPDAQSRVPMVGASGAIAGVMGGYLLLFPKAKVDILIFFVVFIRILPIPAWIVLGLWFGLQFFNGVTVDSSQGGVAYWAHVGGFLAGFALTLPVWLRRGAARFWDRTDGHPPHPEAEYKFVRSSVPQVPRRPR